MHKIFETQERFRRLTSRPQTTENSERVVHIYLHSYVEKVSLWLSRTTVIAQLRTVRPHVCVHLALSSFLPFSSSSNIIIKTKVVLFLSCLLPSIFSAISSVPVYSLPKYIYNRRHLVNTYIHSTYVSRNKHVSVIWIKEIIWMNVVKNGSYFD